MAEPEVIIAEDDAGDEEKVEAEIVEEIDPEEPTGLEDIEPAIDTLPTFLEDANSFPLVIGSGAVATTFSAHQALLVQSPFFAQACEQFSDTATIRRIDLPNDDVDAASAVLEYLYRIDYFPKLSSPQTLEYDSSAPQPDNEGVTLLRHARVYTLAQRFGLPALSALAHKKIHLTQSNATGEIAYARFVYKETSPEDSRSPRSGLRGRMSYVMKRRLSSRGCVWSSRSSVLMC